MGPTRSRRLVHRQCARALPMPHRLHHENKNRTRRTHSRIPATRPDHAHNIIRRQSKRSGAHAYRRIAPSNTGVTVRPPRRCPDTGPPATIRDLRDHRCDSLTPSCETHTISRASTTFTAHSPYSARAMSEGANTCTPRIPYTPAHPRHPATSEGAQHPSGARVTHPNYPNTNTSTRGIGPEGHPTYRVATCTHPRR